MKNEVNMEKRDLAEDLGISRKRAEELHSILKAKLGEVDSVRMWIESIDELIKDKESFFIGFIVGRIVERNDFLINLLGGVSE